MTDKLAEVRETLLLTDEEIKGKWHTTSYEPTDNQISYSLNDIRDRILKAQQDKILNTPIPIEGGVCPECNGKRFVGKCAKSLTGSPNFGHRLVPCSACGGAGKLPGKTITVREALERVIG